MPDRLVHLVLLEVPVRSTNEQPGARVGALVLQLPPQRLAKEPMAAVPTATGIQRADEVAGFLQLGQDPSRAGPSEHGVAQGPGQSVQNRGLHQELPMRRLELVQDLGLEVVEQVAVVSAQPRNGLLRVRGAADRLRGEV